MSKSKKKQKNIKEEPKSVEKNNTVKKKLKKKFYEKELSLLQIELVKLQEWIKKKNLRLL